MADFKKLEIWQRAHAMSVPTNIVEGREQRSDADFRRFLGYSIASITESEYHLIVGHDLGAISDADFTSLTSQLKTIRKMIHGLIKRLKLAADGQ